jgi:hypothetical protein
MINHARPAAHAPRWGRCAVGIMAIRTLHNTFIHTMFEGHVELCSHLAVTLIAEVALRLGQKPLGRGRPVNRVTVRADYIGQSVFGAPDLGPRNLARVTSETVIQDLLRLKQ